VSKSPTLEEQQKEATALLAGSAIQFDGIYKLFEAHAFLSDGEQMDKLRLQLHALLDARLDHTARIMQLACGIVKR
jgi:hypothetical protein